MENPNTTWGEAEYLVESVLDSFYVNQQKPVTDPSKIIFGPSLAKQVTNALREAGLLRPASHHTPLLRADALDDVIDDD